MTPHRRHEVTADGMTRVAAVVASMVETAATDEAAGNEAGGETSKEAGREAGRNTGLTDLIAKAAQVVDRHASAARMSRARGLVQQARASASFTARPAVGDSPGMVNRKLDVTR